jgi:hypothetical protein
MNTLLCLLRAYVHACAYTCVILCSGGGGKYFPCDYMYMNANDCLYVSAFVRVSTCACVCVCVLGKVDLPAASMKALSTPFSKKRFPETYRARQSINDV